MTDLDFMNYQHDMQETEQADFELWAWSIECEYWYLVLVLIISECPHLLHRDMFEGVPF